MDFNKIYKYQYYIYFIVNKQDIEKIQYEDFKKHLQEYFEKEKLEQFNEYLENNNNAIKNVLQLDVLLEFLRNRSFTQEQKRRLDKILMRMFCQYYEIDVNYNIKNIDQINENGETIAMWLTSQCQLIPQYWMHDYNVKNKEDETLKDLMIKYCMPIPHEYQNINKMSIFDKAYFGIIPDIQNHKSKEQDEQGHTVAMLLAFNSIEIPKCWEHKADIQSSRGNTVALIQGFRIKIPDKQWQHKANIQQKGGITVAMRLAHRGFIPPKQWEHGSTLKNAQNSTVAMMLAENGIIPQKQWEHDPNLQDQQGMTVAMYLAQNKIVLQKQWYHKPDLQNDKGMTTAMYIAMLCAQIPDNYWNHNPNLRDKSGRTVAMYIAMFYKQIPPEQWNCDTNLQYISGYTIAMLIIKRCKQLPPMQWQHKPELQDDDGNTIAIYIAKCFKQIPLREWQHDPKLENNHGQTVEDILIYIGLDIPKEWQTNPNRVLSDQDKIIIEKYCDYCNINVNYNIRPEYNANKYGIRIAMFLALNNIIPPKQWYHRSDIIDQQGRTVAMLITRFCKQIPPKEWQHNPNLQDKIGFTVAMCFAFYLRQTPPQQWNHNPQLKNYKNYTVEDVLILIGLNIPKEWQTNPNRILTDEDKKIIEKYCKHYKLKLNYNINTTYNLNRDDNTVAMFLASQEQDIPQQWRHDPKLTNKNGQTVAMIQARNDKIPDKQWEHDPNMQDNIGFTVAIILAYKKINLPSQWYHDPTICNNEGTTIAMILLYNKIIPTKQWIYDLNLAFGSKKDLKHYFWLYNIIPSRYAINISSNKDSIIQYFREKQFPIPAEQQETHPTIFDQAMLRQIPDINGHLPNEQNEDGWTIAMILAFQGIQPPKQWMHNYDIKNKYGYTLRGYLFLQHMLIPEHWHNNYMTIFDQAIFGTTPQLNDHKPDEQDHCGFTVAMILAYNNIVIPKCWEHDPQLQNKYKMTVAMYQALNGKTPDQQWIHNKYLRGNQKIVGKFLNPYTVQNILYERNIEIPNEWKYTFKDKDENTEAMIQAAQGIIPDQKYYHDPLQSNADGNTVAMLLASNNKNIPEEWKHDIMLSNKYYNTVALIYAENGLIPPKEWSYDIDIQSLGGQSIKSLLLKCGYVYQNNQFILRCKTQILNDTCQVCFNNGEQEFIKTTCTHKICLSCYKQIMKASNGNQCPVCKQQDWYEQIDQIKSNQ